MMKWNVGYGKLVKWGNGVLINNYYRAGTFFPFF